MINLLDYSLKDVFCDKLVVLIQISLYLSF